MPDAGQPLPAGLWNRFGRDHDDGSEVGDEKFPRGSVGIQPERRIRRGELFLEAVEYGDAGTAPEHLRWRHRGTAVYPRSLSEGQEPDVFLLQRGMAAVHSGRE